MSTSRLVNSKISDNRCIISWLWAGAIALGAWFAMAQCFTTMPMYDDESYVMLTMETFFDGHPLYQDTYSQYGPAFYFLQTPIHDWLNVPITHDIIRLKTVLTWLLLIGGFGILATAATGSRWVGLLVGLFLTLHLDKLALEPGHPQEVIALAGLAALLAMSGRNSIWLLLAGILTAAVGLTKLNSGAIVALPLLFAVAWGCRTSKLNRWICSALGLCCVLLPGMLCAVFVKEALFGNLDATVATPLLAAFWPAVLALSALLTWIAANRRQPVVESNHATTQPATGHFDVWLVAAGGLIGSTVLCSWAMSKGNTPTDLVWGLLLQHSFMTKAFVIHVLPTPWEVLSASLLAFLVIRRFAINRPSGLCNSTAAFIIAFLLMAMVHITLDAFLPMPHGLLNRGAAHMLAMVGPLLMPLIVLSRATRVRVALAMTGCLGPLLAYPTPGTQLTLGTAIVFVGLIVLFHDVIAGVHQPTWRKAVSVRSMIQLVTAILLLAAGTSSFRWWNNEPLDQPGCRYVRLEPPRAEREKAVAAAIRSTDASTLVFDAQNHDRYFFWTGKKPLTAISPTFWPAMLTDWQQKRIGDALDHQTRVCVVKVGKQIQPQYSRELREKIVQDFTLLKQIDNWQIGIRTRPTEMDQAKSMSSNFMCDDKTRSVAFQQESGLRQPHRFFDDFQNFKPAGHKIEKIVSFE